MNIKRALGKVSSAYVRSARTFFLIFAVVGLVLWSFGAYAQSSCSGLSLSVSNITVTWDSTSGLYNSPIINGKVTASSNTDCGVIHFRGWVVINGYGLDNRPSSINITLSSNDFNPSTLDYPYGSSTFSGQNPNDGFNDTSYTGYSGVIDAFNPQNQVLGSVPLSGGSGSQQPNTTSSDTMYRLIVQLPLINDSMLGATVQPNEPTVGPLGDMYNFFLVVGAVLIGVGVLILLFTNREKAGMGAIIMSAVVSIIVLFIFPLVYDGVARLINSLDIAIITFPNFQPVPDAAISYIWNTASFGGFSIWNLLWTGFNEMIIWIMEIIAYIMMFFLGMVRLFLIAVLLVAFPLALGLRLIPFGGKLSGMIEDTLFGLMLASVMSAVVLGVAANVLKNTNGSVFAGINPAWIAIAAIFAAILMPTVFAPLTGIMMQTVSQAAMTSVGAATMVAAGVGMPLAGGAITAGKAGFGAFQQSLAQQAQNLSVLPSMGVQPSKWLALKQGFQAAQQAFVRHAAEPVVRNAALLGTTGILGSIGATAAAKTISRMAPPPATHADVIQSYEVETAKQTVAKPMVEMLDLAKKGSNYYPGHLVGKVSGRVFQMPNRQPAHGNEDYFSGLRDSWLSMSDRAIVEELVDAKLLEKSILENASAVQEIANYIRSQVRAINPNTEEGMRALYNLKLYIDSEQFKVAEKLK